jgi:hypothetical protein
VPLVSRAAPEKYRLLLDDRNATIADADFDAGGLLSLVIKLVTNDYGGNGEHTDDEIESVTIHD